MTEIDVSNKTGLCDECGRKDQKITRNLFGHHYCATCYAREFKPRACSQCGEISRLLKKLDTPICTPCQKKQPCLRCGKTKFALGKLLSSGPVCNACSVHYRESKPCDACGELSQKRSRVTRLGHDLRLCPKCARLDHASCEACRRHRVLHTSSEGRQLCNVCLKEGERQCQQCGQAFPAGRGHTCEVCYWQALLEKRIQAQQEAYHSEKVRFCFTQFGQWLGERVGTQKASVTLKNYQTFFKTLDEVWGKVPSYQVLVSHFSPEGLRRVRLPMQWLADTNQILVDEAFRDEEAERRRIEKLVRRGSITDTTRKWIEEYRDQLISKYDDGKVRLNTVRNALTAAVKFLEYCVDEDAVCVDQKNLSGYLKAYAGQRASISGFVSYLNQAQDLSLSLPLKLKQSVHRKRKALEQRLREFYYQERVTKEEEQVWIQVCLEYFHGITQRQMSQVEHIEYVPSDGGFLVNWKGQAYWVPSPSSE